MTYIEELYAARRRSELEEALAAEGGKLLDVVIMVKSRVLVTGGFNFEMHGFWVRTVRVVI
ncbi:hypothetical protein Pan54_45560 [Rubinisphaera italica]|uniref:Uncharacterized protein n=1 Tax=Rubinisphaera italica TaxID=2527969 RepID=A0A5C5XKP7_9PLAN|nr:hypothetical protein Pan54_45560 [Rubinisphaera italica]